MSCDGRFLGTDCLPVTGKDGKTQWIFKLEDLREVVPEDVYEAIMAFTEDVKETCIDEWLSDRDSREERIEDGYLQTLLNARDELDEVIKREDTRLNKRLLFLDLKRIRKQINEVL